MLRLAPFNRDINDVQNVHPFSASSPHTSIIGSGMAFSLPSSQKAAGRCLRTLRTPGSILRQSMGYHADVFRKFDELWRRLNGRDTSAGRQKVSMAPGLICRYEGDGWSSCSSAQAI